MNPALLWGGLGAAGSLLFTALVAAHLRLRREMLRRRHVQAALEAREAEARALAEARRRFVAYLSHEARNLVSNLSGALWLVEQRAQETEAATLMRAVRAGALALQDLLDASLDAAQLDAGHFAVRPMVTDVVLLVQGVADEIAPLARQRRLRICPTGELHRCTRWLVDGVRVAQIVRNLVGNAIKYSRGPEIVIRVGVFGFEEAGQPAWRLCLQVVDQGPGMDGEQLRRLFDDFSRVGEPLQARGVGLGLAISRRLARAMGGELRVDSEAGVGSTFALRLPVRPPALASAARCVLGGETADCAPQEG